MNKVLDLISIAGYALGVIGGIGYTIYCGAYVITAGVLITGLLAFPMVRECFNHLTNS